MTLIKACGLRSQADIEVCEEADYHGFILRSESPRNLDLDEAILLMNESEAQRVLVTTERDLDEIVAMLRMLRPDVLQAHSLMPAEDLRRLRPHVPEIWGLLPVGNGQEAARFRELEDCSDGIVLDTACGRGGSGLAHDWSISKEIRERCPVKVILAGGLRAENVGSAVRTVCPDVIDVSSGIELGGRKDRQLFQRMRFAMESAFDEQR